MHPEIAQLAKRFDVAPDAADAFDALFAQHRLTRSVVDTVEDYVSVDVDQTFFDDEITQDLTDQAPVGDLLAGRYEDLGQIGTGGMGEVRRVRDVELNRTLAMKIVRREVLERSTSLGRFLEEAQTTAQLQHPNIVPVHDIGVLPDGRVWFTMMEVRGRTLADVAAEVHAASDWRWNPGRTGWTFRRVIASFLGVCHAVAYAHERGVIHRDLKPDNVMVGRHGEVHVVDWGLAKVVGRIDRPTEALTDREADLRAMLSGEQSIVTGGSHHTVMGAVVGTPAYMAPEQARGEISRIDVRTDVYALGAILRELLTGRMPYSGRNAKEILAQVLVGPPRPIQREAPVPDALVDLCERAMARDPNRRFPSAMALAVEIEAWLDGARKRDQALEITESALAGVDRAEQMRTRADQLQADGDARLTELEPWRPEEDKAAAWALQDEAAELRRAAELAQLEVEQGLHGALQVAPDLPEAHAALAERTREEHAAAEATRDEDGVARARIRMGAHVAALPDGHPTRKGCATYLRGDGALTLVTDPPGAEVQLYRYKLHHRRLVEAPVVSLGTTPLVEVPLPMGSYLLEIRHPDRAPVRYPAHVPRMGHWDGRPPGASEPRPIWLPPTDLLGPDDCYVPAGWFQAGGDPVAHESAPARRLWLDGFAIQRFPCTNAAYLAFLDALVARGDGERALELAPRERSGRAGEQGALIYGFDGERFSLVPDADGDLWDPDWPVMQIPRHGAAAWLAWHAEQTGRPWRLPHELEWEKAARGVDGRGYPWGDHHDPSWACSTDSHRTQRLPAVVDSFPVDCSPYGVRGMGGNMQDWCLNRADADGATDDGIVRIVDEAVPEAVRVSTRGGTWINVAHHGRCASRDRTRSSARVPVLGFRGVFPVP